MPRSRDTATPTDPRALLAREHGPRPGARGDRRLLLAYPAPWRVGMSSLGFLTLHREVSARPGWSVERTFLPEGPAGDRHGGHDSGRGKLRAWESGDPVSAFDAVGISVAHELELGALIRLLEGLGLAPRAADREPGTPLVVVGGPLTGINPRPLAPFADLVVVGEADLAIHALCDALERAPSWRAPRSAAGDPGALDPGALTPDAGFWWPRLGAPPPPPTRVDVARLPAFSERWSPDAELADMALVEVARGCRRACAFCASSRLAAGPCRTVDADRILAAIPPGAPRVGLVGTAVSDHPELPRLLAALIEAGQGVGVSSIRADRLDADLLALLVAGGLRTLTLGVDGASERLRREMRKGVTAESLCRAADLATAAGLRRIKLYQIVGLPGETDADLDEFIALVGELSHRAPVTVTLTPFVPKPGTPLADAPQAPVKEVQRRLQRVERGLRGLARVRPDSARWAWVEALITRGDAATGEAVLAAERAGGRFADYKRALTNA